MKHHVTDSNELCTFNRIDGSQEVTFKDLSDLLFDELYIIKRFELQGPYDATITHLSNWEGAFLYRSSNDNDADEERSMPHSDVKSYESLVALLVSALRSHMISAVEPSKLATTKTPRTCLAVSKVTLRSTFPCTTMPTS
jgi:hypothetical protein